MDIKMERYQGIIEDIAIFVLMAVFSVIKQVVADDGEIPWKKVFTKIFSNFVAGAGFYSFLLAYKPWYGEYPQKVGVIMIVVYAGSRLIDVVVDAIYKMDFKEIIKRWMNL